MGWDYNPPPPETTIEEVREVPSDINTDWEKRDELVDTLQNIGQGTADLLGRRKKEDDDDDENDDD